MEAELLVNSCQGGGGRVRQWSQSRAWEERSRGSSKQMFEGRGAHRGRDRRWQEEARKGR